MKAKFAITVHYGSRAHHHAFPETVEEGMQSRRALQANLDAAFNTRKAQNPRKAGVPGKAVLWQRVYDD